jgi:hypothetical protein
MVSRRVAACCGYLGIQDALHKRRAPSQTPGSWAGSNVVITPEGLAVMVSTEKWKKTQGIITKWSRLIEETGDVLAKDFESDVGILVDKESRQINYKVFETSFLATYLWECSLT